MKTILVPVDFSNASEAALRYALTVAMRDHDKVIVLHAIEVPVYPFAGMWVPEPSQLSDLLARTRQELDALCARNRSAGVILESAVVTKSPTDEAILGYAQEHGCDLIVMSTHGRTGFRHLVLGSVAERVIRAAKIPVLTLRDEAAAKPPAI
jgi:nucleotide-binding universal stress UspA family protein